jgi:RTX calcium-binding nonapeptide repeat (4 copies)
VRRLLLPLLLLVASIGVAGVAAANTSHAGWPPIDGQLIMHKLDQSGPITPFTTYLHNELLGGHGNDVITAGDAGDVIWGDYKPYGQPTTQVDVLNGGAGRDFIYASHGRNIIDTGGGDDVVHAHFGYGSITCHSPQTIVYLSHRSRPGYQLNGCHRISYKTAGH